MLIIENKLNLIHERDMVLEAVKDKENEREREWLEYKRNIANKNNYLKESSESYKYNNVYNYQQLENGDIRRNSTQEELEKARRLDREYDLKNSREQFGPEVRSSINTYRNDFSSPAKYSPNKDAKKKALEIIEKTEREYEMRKNNTKHYLDRTNDIDDVIEKRKAFADDVERKLKQSYDNDPFKNSSHGRFEDNPHYNDRNYHFQSEYNNAYSKHSNPAMINPINSNSNSKDLHNRSKSQADMAELKTKVSDVEAELFKLKMNKGKDLKDNKENSEYMEKNSPKRNYQNHKNHNLRENENKSNHKHHQNNHSQYGPSNHLGSSEINNKARNENHSPNRNNQDINNNREPLNREKNDKHERLNHSHYGGGHKSHLDSPDKYEKANIDHKHNPCHHNKNHNHYAHEDNIQNPTGSQFRDSSDSFKSLNKSKSQQKLNHYRSQSKSQKNNSPKKNSPTKSNHSPNKSLYEKHDCEIHTYDFFYGHK